MQLSDRIEKRRFVGREFLLFLWFESELFDATLHTGEHGSFGLWLERSLVLSEGRESTRILAPSPGQGREAKEALLRGQLPESAGIRVAWNGEETSLVLKADRLAFAGLKLRTVLDKEERSPLIDELTGKGQRSRPSADAEDPYEVFYDRIGMTEEFEGLFEALYRDFLDARLSARWAAAVLPALRRWAAGEEVDTASYAAARVVQATPQASATSAIAEQPQL
jgi:hypothetical protein